MSLLFPNFFIAGVKKGSTKKAPPCVKGGKRLPLLIKGSCPSAHTGAEGIRTPIFLCAFIDAVLQSLSQKSEIFASSLYTRELLGAPAPVRSPKAFISCHDLTIPQSAALTAPFAQGSLWVLPLVSKWESFPPGFYKKNGVKTGGQWPPLQVLWKICNISRISVRQALLTFPEP